MTLLMVNADFVSVLVRRVSELYGHNNILKAKNYYPDSSIQPQIDHHNCALFTCWHAYQLTRNNPATQWGAKMVEG
jgi:hypothetical protein